MVMLMDTDSGPQGEQDTGTPPPPVLRVRLGALRGPGHPHLQHPQGAAVRGGGHPHLLLLPRVPPGRPAPGGVFGGETASVELPSAKVCG